MKVFQPIRALTVLLVNMKLRAIHDEVAILEERIAALEGRKRRGARGATTPVVPEADEENANANADDSAEQAGLERSNDEKLGA